MSKKKATRIDSLVRMPLASHELYRGPELGEAERSLAYLFGPGGGKGRIRSVEGAPAQGTSTVRGLRLTHLTLANIKFGVDAELSIAPQHAYHLAIPRRGEVRCFFGARRVRMATGQMVITRPHESTLIPSWPRGVEAFCIQIRPGALESELSALLGRPIGLPSLEGDLDLSSAGGRSWTATLALLLRELAEADSVASQSRTYADQIERLVLSSLLRVIPHEYSAELAGDVAPARWSSVKRAITALEESPERSWTLAEISGVAGVGCRRLQQGFGQQIGMPPMAYLQVVRLQRVRQELLDGAESIGQSAARWGFTHPGRFSAAYRARYGETPRETRRRSLPVTLDLGRTA